jgi:TetR/AcrR family acrAB operon transcriptional repressor
VWGYAGRLRSGPVTSPKTRRIDEIGQESRRRILDAAEELFAEKGFDRTSFVDIAERSGISRGSIPWHFQNKDGMLIATVERAIERWVPSELSSRDEAGLREILERATEWAKDPTSAMLYTVLTEALSAGPVHALYVEYFRDRRKGIAHLLAAIGGGGFTDADLAALEPQAAVVYGALVGLGLQYRLDPSFDLDGAVEVLRAMILGMSTPAKAAVKARPRGRRRHTE